MPDTVALALPENPAPWFDGSGPLKASEGIDAYGPRATRCVLARRAATACRAYTRPGLNAVTASCNLGEFRRSTGRQPPL